MNDVIDSVKETITERFSSPLFGTFLLTWFAWNHEYVFLLFSESSFTDKMTYAKEVLYYDWHISLTYLFGLPMLTSGAFIVIYPIPAKWAYEYWYSRQNKLKEIKVKISNERILTEEEADKIRQETAIKVARYKDDLKAKESEIEILEQAANMQSEQLDDFRNQLKEKEKTIRDLGDKIADLTFNPETDNDEDLVNELKQINPSDDLDIGSTEKIHEDKIDNKELDTSNLLTPVEEIKENVDFKFVSPGLLINILTLLNDNDYGEYRNHICTENLEFSESEIDRHIFFLEDEEFIDINVLFDGNLIKINKSGKEFLKVLKSQFNKIKGYIDKNAIRQIKEVDKQFFSNSDTNIDPLDDSKLKKYSKDIIIEFIDPKTSRTESIYLSNTEYDIIDFLNDQHTLVDHKFIYDKFELDGYDEKDVNDSIHNLFLKKLVKHDGHQIELSDKGSKAVELYRKDKEPVETEKKKEPLDTNLNVKVVTANSIALDAIKILMDAAKPVSKGFLFSKLDGAEPAHEDCLKYLLENKYVEIDGEMIQLIANKNPHYLETLDNLSRQDVVLKNETAIRILKFLSNQNKSSYGFGAWEGDLHENLSHSSNVGFFIQELSSLKLIEIITDTGGDENFIVLTDEARKIIIDKDLLD